MEEVRVEDVLQRMKSKGPKGPEEGDLPAKKNSRRKGITFEKNLCKILKERFDKPFARSPGSGAFGTVAKVDARALEVLNADIIAPEGFLWSIEAKAGYGDLDLIGLMASQPWFRCRKSDIQQLDEFWNQASSQADRVNRKPVIIYRKDHRPPITMVLTKDVEPWMCEMSTEVHPRLIFGERTLMGLATWLALPDCVFFRADP